MVADADSQIFFHNAVQMLRMKLKGLGDDPENLGNGQIQMCMDQGSNLRQMFVERELIFSEVVLKVLAYQYQNVEQTVLVIILQQFRTHDVLCFVGGKECPNGMKNRILQMEFQDPVLVAVFGDKVLQLAVVDFFQGKLVGKGVRQQI